MHRNDTLHMHTDDRIFRACVSECQLNTRLRYQYVDRVCSSEDSVFLPSIAMVGLL